MSYLFKNAPKKKAEWLALLQQRDTRIAELEATLSQQQAQPDQDAIRFQYLNDKFNQSKTSQSERILSDFGFSDADPCNSLAFTVDAAIKGVCLNCGGSGLVDNYAGLGVPKDPCAICQLEQKP